MPKSSKRPLAVLARNRIGKIGNFITTVRAIVLNIGNNSTLFTTPLPTLATVTGDVDDLETANTLAKTRVTGSAAARDVIYDIVWDDVHGLQGYVQKLADAATGEAASIEIIQSSGFDLKNHGVRVKPLLAAKQGNTDGEILLVAKSAGKRASYQWQESHDGSIWSELPVTLQAKTKVNGLPSGSKIYFRVRAILKDGPASWSPLVSIVVL